VRRYAIILIVLFCASSAAAERGFDGSIQFAYGQHFTGKMVAPTYFPTLEFRFGYDVSRDFTMRLDLGAGLTEITESDRQSFEGATFMVGNFSLVLLYTPEVSDGLSLNLGGALGLWFSAMWGDHDLLGAMSGSMTKYLWSISDRWALLFELRGNLAMVKFGQEYNAGGVTAMVGFVYRVRPSGP
jgi:hypothetical protein